MILLLTPAETAQGGIVNYFKVLKDRFSMPVMYFERGARAWPVRKSVILELNRAYHDYRYFCRLLSAKPIDLVQTSTSLSVLSLIRDGMFLRAAKKQGIKTIVFFRGWHGNAERLINNGLLPLFKLLFWGTDAAIVLSNRFERTLKGWGYKRPVYVETTVADERLTKDFNIDVKMKNIQNKENINLLFLARVEKEKGIYEAIAMFEKIKKDFPEVTMTIAGNGFERNRVERLIDDKGISDVYIKGSVDGEKKIEVFSSADMYIFPSYSEGMPNSVLEAMAFGLPVIATSVGSIPELIKDGINGFIVPKKNIESLYAAVKKMLDREKIEKMGRINHHLAQNRFMTSVVIHRIEQIYQIVMNNETTHARA